MGDETSFSLEELADAAGMTTRNVRAYQTRGLIPPPVRMGRRSAYTHGHLERLRAIRRAREQGATLALIEDYLSRGDTIDVTRLPESWLPESWLPDTWQPESGQPPPVPGPRGHRDPRHGDLSGLLTRIRLAEDAAVLGIVEELIAFGVVSRDGRRILAGSGLVATVTALHKHGFSVHSALTVALRAAEVAAVLAARVGPLLDAGGRAVLDDVADLAALVLRDAVRDGLDGGTAAGGASRP